MKSMFLCGAGASIDAGLADAFSLTKQIYEQLGERREQAARTVFGLVVAKVAARKVRAGGSPFDPVNVEEVYDGVQKLARRDLDLLSDFVTGWDPALAALNDGVSEREIDEAVVDLFRSIEPDRFAGSGSFRLRAGGSSKLRTILKKISQSPSFRSLGNVETSLIRALMRCLQHDNQRTAYFQDIVKIAKEFGGDIATLNYDLIAEDSAESSGFSYDYGLNKWNDQKIVEFQRSSPKSIRIMKLHGSINWYGADDDIQIKEPEPNGWGRVPNLVFGGSSSKLRINGPFLQLRHEFQNRLYDANALVVIGYSFQDEHLNSIIRRWVSTRKNTKFIIINPSDVNTFVGNIGRPFSVDENGKKSDLTVDLIHIRSGAAAAVGDLRKALEQPIQLKREEKSGFVPVYFRSVG